MNKCDGNGNGCRSSVGEGWNRIGGKGIMISCEFMLR